MVQARQPLVLAVLLVLSGCFGGPRDGVGYGGACEEQGDCRAGLVCASDLVCRHEGEPGTGDLGDVCVATSQCRSGLVCSAALECAEPGTPGTAGVGESCASEDDCRAGLSCPDGSCRGLEVPLWTGIDCEPADDDEPYRVYFEVPRGKPLADFFRLPFPNDVRVDRDTLRTDLSGFPSPGNRVPLLGDAVGNLVRVVEEEARGRFGPNQAVLFRFTHYPDDTTLSLGLPGQGTVALVDLTPGAPLQSLAAAYVMDSRRTPYVCDNWLAVHPLDGRPLAPGRTYAVILTRGIRHPDGHEPVQDADFAAMLAPVAPLDDDLARAWLRYQPLRDWLATHGIAPGSLAAAAVFTVEDTEARPRLLREAVHAARLPVAVGLTNCDDDDPYAVPGDASRGCGPGSDVVYELQATVDLPQFQEGRPPFKNFTDGGAIDFSDGPPRVVRTEAVHVAITVPRDLDMPEAGWPVVLYGHGTGGSYTSFVRDGLAETFGVIDTEDGPVGLAWVGFDAPLHGPRAHPENHDPAWLAVDPEAYAPDVLFFNPLNVRAARDNALQAAADLWSLVRWLSAFDVPADQSPTGRAIRFDTRKLYYVGHSQGGVVGPLFAAWEPEVDAVVLSGAGALTLRSFLEKRRPHDLLQAVRVALADPGVTRVHPVLNLAQQVAEASDGVNHARYLLRTPPDGGERRHVLQVFGLGDGYSPDAVQVALARALGVHQVPNGHAPLDGLNTARLPASGNVGGATGLAILYENAGEDAHFVLFDRLDAQHHVGAFLGSAVTDGTPTVTEAP